MQDYLATNYQFGTKYSFCTVSRYGFSSRWSNDLVSGKCLKYGVLQDVKYLLYCAPEFCLHSFCIHLNYYLELQK